MIVIGAADTNQLATQLQAAAAAGITVIASDRLIQNSELVDCSVAVDSDVGELQAESLLHGLEERYGDQESGSIELCSGSPDDSNSAVNAGEPYADDPDLAPPSGG